MGRVEHIGDATLYLGDCLEVMAGLPGESVHAVVTDPPYHLTSIVKRFSRATPEDVYKNAELRKTFNQGTSPYARVAKGFMGKAWDGGAIAFEPETWAAVARVMKPGAHLVAFGGTRTWHRLAVAIEDAGLEIRDTVMWIYGSGFPKSHDVSKGIDKMAGADRETVGERKADDIRGGALMHRAMGESQGTHTIQITAPATEAAKQWQGWGSALKPAHEPIIIARKPLAESSIARNVLEHGTGAINIDGCRVGTESTLRNRTPHDFGMFADPKWRPTPGVNGSEPGRWPANVIHDGSDEVLAGFAKAGDRKTGGSTVRKAVSSGHHGNVYGAESRPVGAVGIGYGDSGSAARFFYSAKASQDERNGSKHPTVKPVALMQYLVRLVTPPGGLVLDPFSGSGSTGVGAVREGCHAVLIERETEYFEAACKRIEEAQRQGNLFAPPPSRPQPSRTEPEQQGMDLKPPEDARTAAFGGAP